MKKRGAFLGLLLVSADVYKRQALEMTQNSMRMSWTFEEVDAKLQGIMVNIFHQVDEAAKAYGQADNFIVGANVAGFTKVANAMMAHGIV